MVDIKKKIYIKTFGCQMNKYDSELITGMLDNGGYTFTEEPENADIILINTCAVRDHAEIRVLGNIDRFAVLKRKNPGLKIGVLGCMAQRLGRDLIKQKPAVDIVAGPDSYRELPELFENGDNVKSTFTSLVPEESYDEIKPRRYGSIMAWVAIMRGCTNYCSYCIVPYVRGPERSRPDGSILDEISELTQEGFKEVTLLGQNVNSYNDRGTDFPSLLEKVSSIPGIKRIRFATSHPKDLSDKLIEVIAEKKNICKYIHLPFQSGSDRILKAMNRKYSREHYINLINKARKVLPDIAFSTDIIAGFPGESEEDHNSTIKLVQELRFDSAFIFRYSVREGTKAALLRDDVPDKIKIRRLEEISKLQKKISLEKNQAFTGKEVDVLIESVSRRSDNEMKGRTDDSRKVIVSKTDAGPGDFVNAVIHDCSSQTLFGTQVKS